MIVRFNQTARQPKPEYTASLEDGTVIARADDGGGSHPTLYLSSDVFTTSFINTRQGISPKGKQLKLFPITLRGAEVGNIYADIAQTGKFLFFEFGYGFRVITIGDRVLTAFEVGLGSGHHHWCFFDASDVLVAICTKEDVTVDYLDSYTAYIDYDNDLLPVLFTLLFVDCTEYPDIGDISGGHTEVTNFYTKQPELREKYDPCFIPKIVARDSLN